MLVNFCDEFSLLVLQEIGHLIIGVITACDSSSLLGLLRHFSTNNFISTWSFHKAVMVSHHHHSVMCAGLQFVTSSTMRRRWRQTKKRWRVYQRTRRNSLYDCPVVFISHVEEVTAMNRLLSVSFFYIFYIRIKYNYILNHKVCNRSYVLYTCSKMGAGNADCVFSRVLWCDGSK